MITVTNLTKKYGPVTAVDGVSFGCEPGTITGFLGPNGGRQVNHAADAVRADPCRPCAARRHRAARHRGAGRAPVIFTHDVPQDRASFLLWSALGVSRLLPIVLILSALWILLPFAIGTVRTVRRDIS
ncbi:MAG TPA: hypothetical protein VGG16_02295 [Streptosporangiaceae bacterium]|jgi:hypothetical protein